MFFKKNLGRKFFKFFRYVLLCSLPVLILSSCSDSQKIKYWEENGKAAAFDHDDDVLLYLASGKLTYNINFNESTRPGYYLPTVNAIKAVNRFSNIEILYEMGTNYDSNISISYIDNRDYALNSISYYSSGEIYKSTITLNSKNMDSTSYDDKIQILLHELGHTLGLIDLDDYKIREYSIMYGYDNLYMKFSDFQEFDIQNIIWCYGGEHLK